MVCLPFGYSLVLAKGLFAMVTSVIENGLIYLLLLLLVCSKSGGLLVIANDLIAIWLLISFIKWSILPLGYLLAIANGHFTICLFIIHSKWSVCHLVTY